MEFCTRSMKSLFAYFKARPPVTMFMFCTAGLALGFFTLSLCVQHNDTLDYEANKEYLDLMSKFYNITFCFSETSNHTEQGNLHDVNHDLVNVSFPLKATFRTYKDLKFGSPVSQLTSLAPYFYILSGDDHKHYIAMRMFLKSPLNPEESKEKLIVLEGCFLVTIKRSALPKELPRETCAAKSLAGEYATLHMESIHNSKHSAKQASTSCSKGLKMNLINDASYKPKVYLNLLDKSNVIIRLNVVSYALLIFLIFTMLYAVMRGGSSLDFTTKLTEK